MVNLNQPKFFGFYILSAVVLVWFIFAMLSLDDDTVQCDDPMDPIISKPGVTNVHIFAHSHDDVGWLNTLQGYYDD